MAAGPGLRPTRRDRQNRGTCKLLQAVLTASLGGLKGSMVWFDTTCALG